MKILICGASMAGLSGAHFLSKAGHDVTVVEMAGSPRSGGVAIDVRGDALGVADRMGILDDMRNQQILVGDVYHFVDDAGREEATFAPAEDFYESPQDIEILRDRLLTLMLDVVPDDVEFRFDTSITSIDTTGDDVSVELTTGDRLTVDLLVGADGMHSQVRALTFGPEKTFLHNLGSYVAIVKDCTIGPVTATTIHNTPGKFVGLRGDGTWSLAFLAFRSEPIEYDFRDVEFQKELVRRAFAGEHQRWVTGHVLDDVKRSSDFYFDSISQIKMDSWSQGRVVLLGDAGYAASFFSGMGTSLAMLGAEALARVLEESDHLALADCLSQYDAKMRGIVDESQAMALEGVDILFPSTSAQIAERNARYAAKMSSS